MSWWKTKTDEASPSVSAVMALKLDAATRECAALLVERADLKLRLDEARLAASEARDRVERMLEMNQRRTRRIETLTDGLRKAQLACKRLRGERDAARAELAKRPTTERAEQLLAEAGQRIVQLQRDLAGAAETNAKLEKLALERMQGRDRLFLLRREQHKFFEGQITKARLACKRLREELRHAQEKLARIQREGAGPAAPSNREPSGSPSLVPSTDDATWKALRLAEHRANHGRAIAKREMVEVRRLRAQADALRLQQELTAKALGVPFSSEPLHLVAERIRKERDEAARANAEFEKQFDLYHDAEMRGIKLWQEAEPGRELTWPDKGKLTAWLLEQLDAAKRELAMVRTNWDGTIESLGQAAIERDEARADAERLRGERDEAKEMHAKSDGLREEHWQEVLRLRSAPPAVAVTDCEKAAREIGSETASYAHEMLAILRKHTRAASVEEVAKAICEADMGDGRRIHLWERQTDFAKREYRAFARAALRALGVREAEKPLTTEEEDKIAQGIRHHEPLAEKNATPFVVDREKIGGAIKFARYEWNGTKASATEASDFDFKLADAAITEYERQRAEWEKGGAA